MYLINGRLTFACRVRGRIARRKRGKILNINLKTNRREKYRLLEAHFPSITEKQQIEHAVYVEIRFIADRYRFDVVHNY